MIIDSWGCLEFFWRFSGQNRSFMPKTNNFQAKITVFIVFLYFLTVSPHLIKLFSDLYERNGYKWDSIFDWTNRPMHSHFTEVPPIPGTGDRGTGGRTGNSSRDPNSRSNTQQTNQYGNGGGQQSNSAAHHNGGAGAAGGVPVAAANGGSPAVKANHGRSGGHMTTDLNNAGYGEK